MIAFRDEPTVRFLEPSVTCFSVSLRDIGVAIAEAMLAQFPAHADAYPSGIVQKLCRLELRIGESDGPARP